MTINQVGSLVNRYRVASFLIHAGGLILFVMLLRHLSTPRVAIAPGRRETAQNLIYVRPGSTESGSGKVLQKTSKVKSDPISPAASKPEPSKPGQLSLTTTHGNGSEGHSAWGSGEITIAYLRYYPHPSPDLSSMRARTEGDVTLSALIDDTGKIKTLTLLAGIDPEIDQAVIQTVREWTFTPALKDGQPISSEQEIHFHFKSPG